MKNKLKKFYIVKEIVENQAFLGVRTIRTASIVSYKNEEEMLKKETFDTLTSIVIFYKEIK